MGLLWFINEQFIIDVSLKHISHSSPSWELELRPLGVATGNALSVTRSEDTYEKTPPVGRDSPWRHYRRATI